MSAGWSDRCARPRGPEASWDERPLDLVRARVALGLEPRPAAEAVVPPFALDAGNVPAEVEVRGELAERRLRSRPRRHLAGAVELVDVSQPAVGATEQERHQPAVLVV